MDVLHQCMPPAPYVIVTLSVIIPAEWRCSTAVRLTLQPSMQHPRTGPLQCHCQLQHDQTLTRYHTSFVIATKYKIGTGALPLA